MGATPGFLFLPPPPLLYTTLPRTALTLRRRPRTATLHARAVPPTFEEEPPDDDIPSQFGERAAAGIVASAGYVIAPASVMRDTPLPPKPPDPAHHELPSPPPPLTAPLDFPRAALHSFDVHGVAVLHSAFLSAVGPLSRAAAAQIRAHEYAASVEAITRIVDGCGAPVQSGTIDMNATDARVKMFETSSRALSVVRAALRAERVVVCRARVLDGRRFDRLVSGQQAVALYLPLRRRGRDKSEHEPQRIRVGGRDVQVFCGDAVVVAGEIEWSVTCSDGDAVRALVVTYAAVEEEL